MAIADIQQQAKPGFDWGGLASGVLSGVGGAFLGPLGSMAGQGIGSVIGALTGGPSKDQLQAQATNNKAMDMAQLEQTARQKLGMTQQGQGGGGDINSLVTSLMGLIKGN